MKHYLFYITAAILFAVWAISKYTDPTSGTAINLLPLTSVAILFYKLITTGPAYRRRGFRP